MTAPEGGPESEGNGDGLPLKGITQRRVILLMLADSDNRIKEANWPGRRGQLPQAS